METALRTDDLIREIFSHLRISGDGEAGVSYANARTLYSAALSCKRFSSHALDALWFSTSDLEPLMNLIPNSQRLIDRGIYLTRPLRNGDLSAFDNYSRRIKEYYEYDSEIPARCRVPVMLDLLHCLNRRHLLPNLRLLYVDSGDMESASPDFYTFLLSPSLQYLSTTSNDWEQIASGFTRIVHLVPHLRRLEVMNINVPDDLLPLVSSFRSLEELSVCNDFVVSSERFSSTFPFSDRLKIWRLTAITIDPRDSPRTSALGSCGFQFPALIELEFLSPRSIGMIAEVFAYNLFPRLETLTIRMFHIIGGRNNDFSKLFSALFSKENRLQYIKIYQADNPIRHRLHFGDVDIFALLEGNQPQELKKLIVKAPPQESLPTSSIRLLVNIFPRLTVLEITVTRHISYADLALLAQGLPHLIELGIGINGQTLPQHNEMHALPLLSHGLRTIDLGNSDLGDPAEFARWLDRLFPGVMVTNVLALATITEMTFILALLRSVRGDQVARTNQQID